MTVALEREHVADGVQGLFGLALLDEANQGVDEDHAQDDARIHPLPQQGGDPGGAQQHIDEDIVDLQQETHQGPALPGGREAIGAETGQAFLGLSLRQALPPGAEFLEAGGDVVLVPEG
jgi:hypothetical protein